VGAGDDGRDDLRDGAVVERVAEGVAPAGRAEVGVDVEVDLERLGPGALFGQGAVGADGPQAPEFDAVGGQGQRSWSARSGTRATSSRPLGPIWRCRICSTTVMAWGPSMTSPDQRT
jgi:hypothetical protein